MPPPPPRPPQQQAYSMREEYMQAQLLQPQAFTPGASSGDISQLDVDVVMYMGVTRQRKYDSVPRQGFAMYVGDLELGDVAKLISGCGKLPSLLQSEPWEGHPEYGKPGAKVDMDHLK